MDWVTQERLLEGGESVSQAKPYRQTWDWQYCPYIVFVIFSSKIYFSSVDDRLKYS